ncbi:hypothetical protein WOLCODRAFT_146581 [Wolfiporia cocos MD-104 SS10]|uniref:UBR-type domain-containing protein n=1 Tax=Wolfiporia cocos (strain MD-104) TaxID=742152 RepID=A0A2H3JBM3_WOLCO|nr:hypothetical protein WOLCODRAFT_146581 [Wolfiporia cocos MD-104 SS10]
MSQTIASILASQHNLIQAAAEALPHQFSQCTYLLGPVRQAVYLCRTCAEPRGICSACSIACHPDHEQLELFPKRAFRCDCPTAALAHPCTLHQPSSSSALTAMTSAGLMKERANAENAYGQNFRGLFCRCARPYDAQQERETMIQCLACEDWFHESCLNLRERPSSREPTPDPAEGAEGGADDAASEASSSGLPPPLLSAADYDALVCVACVRSIPTLRRYAGTHGALMVVRGGPEESWRVIGREADTLDVEVQLDAPENESTTGDKRALSPDSADAPAAKKARVSPEPTPSRPCLAPLVNPLAQRILDGSASGPEAAVSQSDGEPSIQGAGDVFLTDGWQERWCRCDSCLPSLQSRPYLLEEEETYEPPEDPDSGLNLEELGLRALSRLPHDQAIDGIRAFNALRDDLMSHLRPFAQEGREVTEADIRAFFDARTQANP